MTHNKLTTLHVEPTEWALALVRARSGNEEECGEAGKEGLTLPER
jgi:hypothetical protein